MRQQLNRRGIVISALLTAAVLTLLVGGLVLANGWPGNGSQATQDAADLAAQEQPPIVVTVQPVLGPEGQQAMSLAPVAGTSDAVAPVQAQTATDADIIALYQARLDEAYQALEEAYAQIDALQAAQNQAVSRPSRGDDDEHEAWEHEGGEREHGESALRQTVQRFFDEDQSGHKSGEHEREHDDD